MMINDPLSDMIARIKNAATRKRSTVLTPASRLRQRVLDVLKDEGYIRGYSLVEKPGEFPQFEIELKYFDGQPVIAEIARVSKPGRRVYSSISGLKPVKNGLGIAILSTSKGVMSDSAARDENVGGEVLCRVYRYVTHRQKSDRRPVRRDRHHRRPDRHGEGAQGPAGLDGRRGGRGRPGERRAQAVAARGHPARPRHVGPVAFAGGQHGPRRHPGLRAEPRAARRGLPRRDEG